MRNLTLLAALTVAASSHALTDPLPFGPGEQSLYEVRFLGVPAGIAQITVGLRSQRDGTPVLPLVCVGQTTSIASVFQIRDRFISYYDPSANRPVGVDYFIDENRDRRREQFRFDREGLKVHAHKKREGQGPYDVSYDVPEGAMDLAAAAFRLRTMTLKVGEVHQVPVFTGARWYLLTATIEGQETISTKLGELPVYRVSITTDFHGSAATRGNIVAFYTADARHLPVRVQAEFVVGSATADIVEYLPGSSLL